MARYTKSQANSLAQQIARRFGTRLAAACALSSQITPEFLAGLISLEAGKDKSGRISETATRFEEGVFADLQSLRDNGFCYVNGRRCKEYSGVERYQIRDASDAALRALSKSYGLTQIMGWHTINDLKCKVEDLRDPEKHLGYAVKLAELTVGEFVERGDYQSAFKVWNTGSANGKTHDPSYCANGAAVIAAYRALPDECETDEDSDSDTAALSEPEAAGATATREPAEVSDASAPVAAVVAPLPNCAPTDAVTRVTSPFWSRIYAASGGVAGLGAALKGVMGGGNALLVAGLACITVLLLALILRQAILDWVRLQAASDPSKYNVK